MRGPVELLVSDEPITFDRVTLDAEADGDDTHVQLIADTATASLQLSGTIADCGPDDLAGKTLRRIVDPSSDVQISDGLTLADGSISMRPRDVTVNFSESGGSLTITLSGTLQRDGGEDKTTTINAKWTFKLKGKPD